MATGIPEPIPAADARPGRPSPARAWVWGLPVAVYLAGAIGVFAFKVDDSYISLRYAENLAAGRGLVFNPGGARIEGFTNLLLVLAEAGLARAGWGGLLPVKLLLVVATMAMIAGIALYARSRLGAHRDRTGPSLVVAAATAILVASSSPVVLWSVSGLETSLFAALVTAALCVHCAHAVGSLRSRSAALSIDALFLLAVMTRPEGLLFWGLAGTHAMALLARRPELPLRAERLASLAIGLAGLGAFAAWKLAYFGSLLPATSIAKIAGPSFEAWRGGAARFASFLAINGHGVVAILVAVGLVAAARRRERALAPIWTLAACGGAYLLYVVSLGRRVAMDDAYRLYVPLVPIAALVLVEAAAASRGALDRRAGRWVAGIVVGLAVVVPLRFVDLARAWRTDLNWGSVDYQVAARDVPAGLDRAHAALGAWLRERAPAGATAVLYDAGAIPYFSGLEIIDTWSLVDPYLVPRKRALREAESPEERKALLAEMRRYVLARNPEFIVQDDLSLLDDPAVRARYRKLGPTLTYLDWYLCGPNRPCRYDLEPWVRADLVLPEPGGALPARASRRP